MRNRIRELRTAKRLTLEALAGCVNSSNQHPSHLETGKRRLTVDWIERLARGLECDPLELLSANLAEITEQERALLNIFRTLNDDQRDAFIAAAAALAGPSTSS